MTKRFQLNEYYRCQAPDNKFFTILVINRTESTVTYICEEKPENGARTQVVKMIREPLLSEGFVVVPAYDTESVVVHEENGTEYSVLATEFDKEERRKRQLMLSKWHIYNMVDNSKEMFELVNILEAHGESPESLQEFVASKEDVFCGFVWIDLPDNEYEVSKLLFDHNRFYQTKEALLSACCLEKEDTDMTLAEFLAGEDIYKTSGGYVRILHD